MQKIDKRTNHSNNLINEKSPYLIQHAYNPVNWYPWCSEAFEKAKEENKLIFLSIGYSTCHWCHVMEHESFEDEEVAKILNEHFVSIKVDKEERPDIDAVYMEICQIITGEGGWPLTILMTPEQKPVFAGTYFPKKRKFMKIGFIELLETFRMEWEENSEKLVKQSEKITAFLYQDQHERREETVLDKEIFKAAVNQYEEVYDKKNGGFGRCPKFPSPHNLLFLLRYGQLENRENIAEMAYHTLVCMYRGGIFDHVGGGFARYSTDDEWLVPHFEKILYDNAMLAYVYLEAFQMSKRNIFREVAERILQYILGEMTNLKGGFYCGQDADSEGKEGKYYIFTKQELLDILGEERGAAYCEWYGVTEKGNYYIGENVLNLNENTDYENTNPKISSMNQEVKEHRRKRMKLHRDEKILTAWNGLMIAAFAKAYQVLGEKQYVNAAKRAEEFVKTELLEENGRLKIRYCDGEAAGCGQLNDYVFMVWAELELYRATLEVQYLESAIEFSKWIIELFQDKDAGGFYFYAADAEQLIYRPKEIYDGAIPSGNGMAAYILVQLEHLTGELVWSSRAEKQLCFLSSYIKEHPTGCSVSLLAMMEELYASRELVCVAKKAGEFELIKNLLREKWNKNLYVLGKTEENAEQLARTCPYTENYPIWEERVSYYLCQDGACMPEMHEIEKLKEILQEE